MPTAQKEAVVRWFARAIADLGSYIPGPDMGTDERCMAWVLDEIGRSVGLPAVLGGIPLDEIGATGYGLAVAAEAAQAEGVVRLDGARVAIQGFGAVGSHAARFLVERGASIVAVSDSRGAVFDAGGLPLEQLLAGRRDGKDIAGSGVGRPVSHDAVLGAECEILVPAARPDVITAANVDIVRAAIVLEGANIPVTDDAEGALHHRGVLCLPDFVANAGGVICGAVEYAGGTRAQAFETIAERVAANTTMVIERARAEDVTPRAAADAIARARVHEAMALRRSFHD
jgi:glutamate dehydrogenase/leucine dehydrogenase